MSLLESKYAELCRTHSDINEHLPTLRKYASDCKHVTEMGVRWIVSTWALLSGKPRDMVSYDIRHPSVFGGNIDEVRDAAIRHTNYRFMERNVLDIEIEETDLLFIDTFHTGGQLRAELKKHARKVRKYIILHDTVTFGERGEDGGEGLKTALNEFLAASPQWKIHEVFSNNNGLTVLKRIPGNKKNRFLRFIVPSLDLPYYNWQMLVQINNFKKLGYDLVTHYPIMLFADQPTDNLKRIMESADTNCHFHLYQDKRPDGFYAGSRKTHLMSRFFEDFPEEEKNVFMYMDADAIFLDRFDFLPFMDDDIWYQSDTRSYLDSKYIKSKGDQLFTELCEIAGVTRELIENNDVNAGGAQYITKNNTAKFWEDVEALSVKLFRHMKGTETKYHPPGQDYPIQSWTAEMFATNWQLWKLGMQTKVVSELHFNWANHPADGVVHKIYHNAGVTENDGKHFAKTHYQSSPFRKEKKYSKESLSSRYVDEIIDTENNFADVIWD